MKTTVYVDDQIFNEAFRLSGAKTKKELINMSLEELVRKKKREDLASMYGTGAVEISREEAENYRACDK